MPHQRNILWVRVPFYQRHGRSFFEHGAGEVYWLLDDVCVSAFEMFGEATQTPSNRAEKVSDISLMEVFVWDHANEYRSDQ